MVALFANSGDPDQAPHSVASALGLHCLPNTLLGVSRLQWVNHNDFLMNQYIVISFYPSDFDVMPQNVLFFLKKYKKSILQQVLIVQRSVDLTETFRGVNIHVRFSAIFNS